MVLLCKAFFCIIQDWSDELFSALREAGGTAYSNYAVGYNNVKVPAATKNGIPVGNTPGEVAEYFARDNVMEDNRWGILAIGGNLFTVQQDLYFPSNMKLLEIIAIIIPPILSITVCQQKLRNWPPLTHRITVCGI